MTPTLFAALFCAAHAQEDVRIDRDVAGDNDWSVPLYVQARGALAVPSNAHGDVATAGFGVGIVVDQTQSIGLRVIYMDDPPDNPFATETPPLPRAWGPVVDWTWVPQANRRASLFTTVSLGYVYGTPEDENHDNVILPIVEGGLGLRFSKRLDDGRLLYVAPEIGFVPGAVAPLSALTLGMVLPGGQR